MRKWVKNTLTITLLVLVVLSNLMAGLAQEANTIEYKSDMNVGRDNHSAVVVDGYIYVLGGHTYDNSESNSLERYNITMDSWEAKANLLTGRRLFAASSYNGKIYVFGGMTADNNLSTSVEVYDIATDTWEAKADMPQGRHAHRAVTVGDKIYVMGGRIGNGLNDMLDRVDIYDPINDTWQTGEPMPFKRFDFSVAKIGSKIYVMGGVMLDGTIHTSADLQVYDTVQDTWATKANLITQRQRFGAVAVGNKIYAIGGYDGSGIVTNEKLNIEVYDSVSNSWTELNQLTPKTHLDFACVSVENKIYILGGLDILRSVKVITVENDYEVPISPTNLTATPANAQVTLNWNAVDGAESYNVKRSTTQGGPYTSIANNVTTTTYVDTNVTNGTTYYYVVTAVNVGGESDNSNEASATPVAPVINRALLHITMQNGFIKEYDMAMTEVESFISWYNSTSGSNLYTINKFNKIGPFLNRKDYLVKDKVMYFEVLEYESN